MIFISILFSALLINSSLLHAAHDGGNGDGIIAETMQQPQSAGITRVGYYTWTVVESTDDTFILERKRRSGKMDSATIARSRRPRLKEGDKVRYDRLRNRLRRTLRK